MDRETAVTLWREAQHESLWQVPWSKAVEGLTAAQAAWKPSPQRHSIWQNVHHLIFWREAALDRPAGRRPSKEEIAQRNWEEPHEVSDGAWQAAVGRLAESHRKVMENLPATDEGVKLIYYLIAHDSYHVGQIMYIRALQGLPPIPD